MRVTSPETIEKTAAAIESHVKDNEAARKELGRISTAVAGGGKLADYGTPAAQELLRKWAKVYGPKPQPEAGARETKP